MPEVGKVSDVCWIGAKSLIKGYDILVDLVMSTDFTFTLIMKDDIHLTHPRVRTFNRVPHAELPAIINSCRVGLCTSRVETQHLAGIEMGACGLPMLTTDVGIYWNRPGSTSWGIHSIRHLEATGMMDLLTIKLETGAIRNYWIQQDVDRESCRKAWLEATEWATR
jgi:hypothetical protein